MKTKFETLTYQNSRTMKKDTKQQNSTDTQMGYDTVLSAGICDTCIVPKMVNSGDGVSEPLNPVLFCNKMNTEIEPLPLEERRTECEFYACR